MRELIEGYGLLLVALNVFVEQLGLPIPAVPTLIVAGALARDGRVPGISVALAAVLAAVAADCIWFTVGRRYGSAGLRVVCRLSLSPDACVRNTESLFTRLGARALLIAKFVPGLSAVSTPLAGASGMRLPRFLVFDTVGAMLWAGSAILAGALLHRQVDETLAALESLGSGAAAVLAGILTLYILWRLWERRRFARAFAMSRIAPDELAARLTGENPPRIFDVRSTSARLRDQRAIPGAEAVGPDATTAVPDDREIVLYCT